MIAQILVPYNKMGTKTKLREIDGIIINTLTNLVQDGTIPVSERMYYGSQIFS